MNEFENQNSNNIMQEIRREKSEIGRYRNESIDEVGRKYLKEKEKKLRVKLTKVINKDSKNAEARYRYAFFFMERGYLTQAIKYFEAALVANEKRNCTFPIDKSQVLKAHMYIGCCAGELLKNSLTKIEELKIEKAALDDDLKFEGRSLTEVLEMIKNQSEYYEAYHNGNRKIISLQEYLKFKAGDYGYTILVSFVDVEVFIKVGEHDYEPLTTELSAILRFMVDQIMLNGIVTYDDFRYVFGTEQPWDNIRNYVNRINRLIRVDDENQSRNLFEITASTTAERYPKKYQLSNTNYIFVFRQSDFSE